MITSKLFLKTLAILAFLFCGCSQSYKPTNYMVFDDIQYINEFPNVFSLNNPIEIETEIIGIRNLFIYDSLLILPTTDGDGFWSFISLPDFKFLGKFLTRGNGPYEFRQSPYGSCVKFIKENNILFAFIYDFDTGKLYKMNIDESIKNNKLSIYALKKDLPPFIFDISIIDSVTFFCKEIDDSRTRQIRYILDKEKKTTQSFLEQLNQATIREGEDFNILSTATKQNFDRNIIVEAPISLNYINMYSLNGSFRKTICIGNVLDNMEKIQNKARGDRLYTFSNLRLFPDFWGVLYVGESDEIFQTERKKHSVILLFDWNGDPLAEIKLNRFATTFDMDVQNGFLYTLDLQTDEFKKYDIRSIMEKLKSVSRVPVLSVQTVGKLLTHFPE